MTTRPPRTITDRRQVTTIAVGLAAALLVGCTGVPEPVPGTDADGGTASPEPRPSITALDAEVAELDRQVAALRATITALRAELDDAAAGDDAALERAGHLLAADLAAASDPAVARAAGRDAAIAPDPSTTGDPGGVGGTEDASGDPGAATDEDGVTAGGDGDGATPTPGDDVLAPVLPGPAVSRAETIAYGDLLTTTQTAARGAGRAGEPVLRFLEAPLAGVLGSWQRAPDDQLAAIAEAGRTTDIEAATTAVLELEGEAPRALAWVVHGLTTDTTPEEAALRALAHLTVIETALEDLG